MDVALGILIGLCLAAIAALVAVENQPRLCVDVLDPSGCLVHHRTVPIALRVVDGRVCLFSHFVFKADNSMTVAAVETYFPGRQGKRPRTNLRHMRMSPGETLVMDLNIAMSDLA